MSRREDLQAKRGGKSAAALRSGEKGRRSGSGKSGKDARAFERVCRDVMARIAKSRARLAE
ncbi:MAG: hypothetical protein H6923_03440 [Alphaproteobacteria bacterium]|nr:hypothetical protein [Alphaproteobacteria bacterium]